MSDKKEVEVREGKRSFDWTFVKGFAAGIIVSNINKIFVLGALIGTVSGLYIEQNYDEIPHVKTEMQRILTHLREASGKSRKNRNDNEE